jgi:hypothetical protein
MIRVSCISEGKVKDEIRAERLQHASCPELERCPAPETNVITFRDFSSPPKRMLGSNLAKDAYFPNCFEYTACSRCVFLLMLLH